MNEVILGDCLEEMNGIDDKSIDMIICDLPYNTTACHWDKLIPFEPLWEQYKRIIKDNGAIVLTASQPFTSALVMSNVKMFKYCWTWKKSKATGYLNAKKQPMRIIEDICIFYSNQCTFNRQMKKVKERFIKRTGGYSRDGIGYGNHEAISSSNNGEENPFNFLEIKSEGKPLHPTQKPVALFEYLIKTYTNEGDTVLDNCAGSGTTGVACIRTKRYFILIEKDSKYFKIASDRINEELKQITLI